MKGFQVVDFWLGLFIVSISAVGGLSKMIGGFFGGNIDETWVDLKKNLLIGGDFER